MGRILAQQRGHVLVLTIDNEAKRNALDQSMSAQLLSAFRRADQDSSTRVAVVTGAGDVAFCSGHDLREIGAPPPADPTYVDPCGYPSEMAIPVIAAVNGHCHAFGLLLALSCDLRVASENAVFGQPSARLGMLPVGGQLRRLPQVLPHIHAMELMMTAEPMPAARAYALGFLNRLVPRGKALDAAIELASKIADNSPNSVKAIKYGVKIAKSTTSAEFSAFEREMADQLKSGPDAREGVLAFKQKRKPVF